MKKTYKSYTVSEATRSLEKYCAYQERCHQEVVSKLRNMQMIPEAIDQITVHLISNNYLNEERFAVQFAHGKFYIKKWGKIRLKQELQRRNISGYIIEKALAQIDQASYLATFNEISEKRWEQLAGEENSRKKRRKLMEYLHYRGWESDLIYERINRLQLLHP